MSYNLEIEVICSETSQTQNTRNTYAYSCIETKKHPKKHFGNTLLITLLETQWEEGE